MVTSLVLFGFSVYVISNIISFYIRNKFQIQSINPRTPINKTHKWVGRILLFLILLILICAYFYDNYFELLILSVFVLNVISIGFDTYMEYKHERKEREYLLKSVSLFGSIVFLIGALYFLYHTTTLEEVLEKYGDLDPEEIIELEVHKRNEDARNAEKAIIKDKQLIEQLFAEMEKVEARYLISGVEDANIDYHLFMRRDDVFFIEIDEEYIGVDFDYYKVTGENYIYKLLESSNIEWESEE